jgi:succinoglycan biosynthesis transport protein ExoP
MLQTQKTLSAQDDALPFTQELGLGDMVAVARRIICRQWPFLLVVPLITLTIGAIYLWVTPPTYIAKAQIIIERAKSPLQQQSIIAETPVDSAQIESQISVLESERIASSVIKGLRLTEDSEFVGAGLLTNLL